MTMNPGQRRRRERSILDSPILSGALVIGVLGLVGAIAFVPGLLGPASSAAPSQAGIGPTATPAGPTSPPTFAQPTPSPAPTFLIHIVRSGDSLNSIARTYRTSARSIAWWNRGAYPNLDPESPSYAPNDIKVGWRLVVLPDTVVDDNNPPTPSPGPPSAPPTAAPAASA